MDRFDAQGRMVGREHDLVVAGEQVLRSADDAIEADWKNLDGQSTQVMGAGTARTQSNLAHAPRAYLVQAGDTLPRIARAVWGDASLWTFIAEANGIADPDSISAGQLLSLPSPDAVGAGSRFGSAALRPYDPSQAVGDTSPNLPPPPSDSGGGCGGVGQVLQIVVAVVVAAYVGPEVLSAFGEATTAATATASSVTLTGAEAVAAVSAAPLMMKRLVHHLFSTVFLLVKFHAPR